jgi:hypothetical protein
MKFFLIVSLMGFLLIAKKIPAQGFNAKEFLYGASVYPEIQTREDDFLIRFISDNHSFSYFENFIVYHML